MRIDKPWPGRMIHFLSTALRDSGTYSTLPSDLRSQLDFIPKPELIPRICTLIAIAHRASVLEPAKILNKTAVANDEDASLSKDDGDPASAKNPETRLEICG
ncbi:hypothetical protein D9619_013468 [Psilocybe cf. subviscida]|uniref:Uncharacterized protein n=1 Tax=Psilocybe cf. subviscida TaxID=2480587 RepID=A0A8H5BS40_9AGAR|nr:hypothetical protein D9619_013468 [Psilocybe cf. subviscida]